jgi:hypothetical protein
MENHMLTIIFSWLFFCLIVSVFARQRRNRDGFGWFLFSVIFSPLLGFLLVACLKSKPEQVRKGPFARRDVPAPAASNRDPRWDAMRSTPLPPARRVASKQSVDLVTSVVVPAALIVAFFILAIALGGRALAQNQTTFRDAGGRTVGTATTDSQGTTTYRDSGGRTTGTASRDSQGTTTFRDAGGRTTGTATGVRK